MLEKWLTRLSASCAHISKNDHNEIKVRGKHIMCSINSRIAELNVKESCRSAVK